MSHRVTYPVSGGRAIAPGFALLSGAKAVGGNLVSTLSATIQFLPNLVQTNLLGAVNSGVISFAGDITLTGGSTWDFNTEYLLHF